MGRVFFAKIRMVLWLLVFSGRPPRDHPGGVRYIFAVYLYLAPHIHKHQQFWGCLHTLAHRRWGKVYFMSYVASYVVRYKLCT